MLVLVLSSLLGMSGSLPLRIICECVCVCVCTRLSRTGGLLPPELGRDVGLDDGLLVELLRPLLLGLHLLVLLEVLDVLGVGEVFELCVFVVVPGRSVLRAQNDNVIVV